MKKFKFVEWHQGLNEMGQQLDTKFSFAHKEEDGSYSNTMPWVKCRDYFGDALHAVQTSTKQGIYGFSFNPKKQPFDTDKCRLLIKFTNEESYNAYLKNYNHFKKELRPLTSNVGYGTIHKTDDPLVLLVVANPLWQQSVMNISWFTYVHKCLSYPNLDHNKSFYDNMCNHRYVSKDWQGNMIERNTNEQGYIKDKKNQLEVYLKHIKAINKDLKFIHGWDVPKGISIIHNSSGFSSMLSNFWGEIGQRIKNALDNQAVAQA